MKQNSELKKELNRLRRIRFGKYGLITGCLFAISATVVYFAIPDSAKGSEGDLPTDSTSRTPYVPDSGDGLTAAQKFSANLTSVQGLTANLSLTASDPKNTFEVASTIAFSMPELALKKIGLNLTANVKYNGTAVMVDDGALADTLDLDMIDGSMYVSLMGINYKSAIENRADLFKNIIRIFDLQSAQVDLSSLSSLTSGEGSSSITDALSNIKEEDLSDGTYRFTLTLDGMNIYMTSDKDCVLTSVYSDPSAPLVYGDWTIGFNLSNVVIAESVAITNPESLGKKYYELNDSVDLIERLYKIYKDKNLGLSFEASLLNGTADLALSGSANVDFSANNIFEDSLGLNLTTTYSYFAKETDLVKASDTQMLGAVYTPEAAYLTYNTNALRAKMSHGAMDELKDSITEKFGEAETKSASTAFDFITTSPVMKGVYEGHYEAALKMLKKVETADNYMKITLSLNQLGFGSTSEVTVALNGAASSPSVAEITIKDLILSGTVSLASASFRTVAYSSASIDEAKAGAGYLSLDFAGDVFEQAYTLANEQKFGIAINSASDAAGTNGTVIEKIGTTTKFVVSGKVQADIKSKVGTGTINLLQTSSSWDDTTSMLHSLTADLTAPSEAKVAKLIFSYHDSISSVSGGKTVTKGGDKPLNGSLTVASLEDIVTQVKSAVAPTAPDQRWAKFFAEMKEQAATTVIGRLTKQDYGALLESKILKSVTSLHNDKTGFDEIKAVVDGHLLGDDGHDIVVYLPLGSSANNTDEVKGFRLENFVYGGYNINVDLSLNGYDATKVTNLTEDSSYLGLSSLQTLVKFGLKTSYLTSYHLTAKMKVKLLINISMDIDVNFYLSVVDKTVKVSGYFDNIPLLSTVNNDGQWALMDTFLGDAHRNVEFFYQAPANGGTGGTIFLIERNFRQMSGDTTVCKKVYAPYFTSNLLYYLMNDVVALKANYISSITKTTEENSKNPIDIESVLKSYSFADGAKPSFTVVMDMAVLSNNSQLGDMSVTVGSNVDGYLSTLDFQLGFNIPVLNLSLTAAVTNADIGQDNWTGSSVKNRAADAWSSAIARTTFDSVEGF